ncbi:MAG: hypothetical protein IRZ03_13560 [Acidobacterium ailaaui]|nr:hypothetical protein [Pseudacidobacterium ailaaui]
MAYAYALFAAICAVCAESWMRSHDGPHWWSPVFAPAWALAVGVNWGVWHVLRTENLVGFAVIFSTCTATLRMAWTLYSGDHVPVAEWVAFALLIVASAIKQMF